MRDEDRTLNRSVEAPPAPVYELLGAPTFRRLVDAFYARVERDAVLRPMYPRSLHCARENLTAFLAQFFGAPPGPWPLAEASLRTAHARLRIGPAEREAWLTNMR